MKTPKPKKPSRKFVLIEVETDMSNPMLRDHVADIDCVWSVGGKRWTVTVLQVHVNAAKKEKAK